MKVYLSIPDREIVDVDLPAVPSIGHSIADEGGRLHKVIGVVWDLTPPPDGRSGGGPFEVWVFCEPDPEEAQRWSSEVVPFPSGRSRAT